LGGGEWEAWVVLNTGFSPALFVTLPYYTPLKPPAKNPRHWVKPLAIASIVLGALRLMDSVFGLLSTAIFKSNAQPGLPELSPVQNNLILGDAITGLLVNIALVVAGALFISQKPISIKLMYGALIAGLLYRFLPLVLLSRYDAPPWINYDPNNPFNYIGPLIDIGLIAGVIYVTKARDEAPTDFVESGKPPKKSVNPIVWKISSLLGFLFMLIPLSSFILWLYISRMDLELAEKSALFHSYFPDFLKNDWRNTAWLCVFVSLVGIAFSTAGLSLTGKYWKVLSNFVLAVCILTFLFFLFSLM
jgi:hypothetical protein